MFIPLHDRNALEHVRRPYVTYFLVFANTLVWLFTSILPQDGADSLIAGLGFIPSVAFGEAVLDPTLVIVPADFTALTYAFLHEDFWHLASNMIFLWVFGDNVEDAMGHFRFIIFYAACAAAGALFHGLFDSNPDATLIGASGAISGIVAAYLLLHPKVWLWVLILFRYPVPLPAVFPLAFWVLQQFFFVLTDTDGTVSWEAHVGGIVAGAILTLFMRRRGVPLFDRQAAEASTVVHDEGNPIGEPPPPPPEEKTSHIRWGRG